MKIGIGNDHRGYKLKVELVEFLKNLGYEVVNFGSDSEEAVDYPVYAFKVGEAVAKGEVDRGILICRTGIGMSIAANKVKGVRCARVLDEYDAKMTRIDNDANVIALSSRYSVDKLEKVLKVFLETPHVSEERHDRRISKIDNYEC